MTPQTSNQRDTPAPRAAPPSPIAWIRDRVAELRAPRASAPPRLPARPRVRAPRTSWLGAFWTARLAVRAGIPLEEFLRHRLSQHLAALSVPPSRLPLTVDVAEGAVVTRPTGAAARSAPWLDAFLRAEGPAALAPEIQLAQADAARLAARIEAQRARVEEATRVAEEASRGKDLADPADEAQAQQAGRPPVPPPWGVGLLLFALLLLLAETWQLAVPCLEAAGIRTTDLTGELRRNPVGLVLGGVFALGASVSLFLFAHLALRRGIDLFQREAEPRRRAWTAAAAGFTAALAAAMAWSIAGMRPGPNHPVDVGYARWTLFLIALAIPATATYLVRMARDLGAARAEALSAARSWDQEHYRSYAELSRRAAALAEEERRLARLEADRAVAVRRLRTLQQRSIAAQRVAADAADEEEAELARVGHGISAALELDRYEYVRQATARGTWQDRRAIPPPPDGHAGSPVQAHGIGLAG